MNKRGVSCGNDLVGHQPSGTTTNLVRSYVWGLDLSGTEQGAGGVGGLLFSASSAPLAVNFYCYDGNGNVVALVDSLAGGLTAQYEYGPFGEVIRATGSAAEMNPYRFSTKYQDDETGLLYYGYRYYQPVTGRWPNRDPLHELGHQTLVSKRSNRIRPADGNLYLFVDNDPLSKTDPDGRSPIIVGGAVIGIVAACAYPQYKAAFSRYEDSGDKFKHCWVSCRISKTCGGAIAQLAGLGKEARDRAVAAYCELFPDSEICQGGHGDFWDSIDDIIANNQCMGWESRFGPVTGWIGALCRRSCEDCCKEKVGYHTGE
jgi:RHS repeat-associated protein